ncbi:MAG: peptidase S8 [Chitinophagaceae bacterium]|nr:MAG: peptidase S8 [Chitinophagaceae bacterium]
MKQHFVIKISKDYQSRLVGDFPYWRDFILDKSRAVTSFFPEFDQLLAYNLLSFWVTKEYKSQFMHWNEAEIFSGLDRFYRVIMQQDLLLPDNLLEKIKQLPHIEDATTITVVEAEIPRPLVSAQQSYSSVMTEDLIYLKYAKLLTKGSPDVVVAVLDTGINLNHRELTGKLVHAADFVNMEGLDTTGFIGDTLDNDDVPEDEVGHGTHVSGIIAARGINMNEGVAPNCRIMPVRVLATMKDGNRLVGAGIIDNINTGIKYAVDHGADIINMSLGIQHEGGGLPHEEVINYALSKDVTIVAASGNDGRPIKYYPGALPGVIAVGAVDQTGSVTSFSSYGAEITVVAPGADIYSSFSNNTYAYASGTSQASPFVCGSIALLKSYAKQHGATLTNNMIRYILQNSSDKTDRELRTEKAGYGLINMADAFKLLQYIIKK